MSSEFVAVRPSSSYTNLTSHSAGILAVSSWKLYLEQQWPHPNVGCLFCHLKIEQDKTCSEHLDSITNAPVSLRHLLQFKKWWFHDPSSGIIFAQSNMLDWAKTIRNRKMSQNGIPPGPSFRSSSVLSLCRFCALRRVTTQERILRFPVLIRQNHDTITV